MPGSVRKRGNSWEASVAAPRVPGGPRRIWESLPTKREANLWIAEQTRSVALGDYIQPSARTVAEVFEECLVAGPGGITRTSHRSLGRRLLQAYGARPIQSVTTHMLERFAHDLRSARSHDTGDLLSGHTIQNHLRSMRMLFRYAERKRYIRGNPSLGVTMPKRVQAGEMTILSASEADALARAARGHALEPAILLALFGGLRRGEALGLAWSKVNLSAGTITIRQAMTVQPGGARMGLTKTLASERTIALPRTVLERLVELRSETHAPGQLVCSTAGGGAWNPGTFGRAFRSFLASNRIAHMRFHDLRHTHVSLLIAAGVHIKVISMRLGHSSIEVTMDTYGHLVPGVEDGAMAGLEALMAGARPADSPGFAA